MLLVLISVMMATITATAYLASRDNSSLIGGNVASSAAARWAALSGLEIGIAVLQTDSDWRGAHVAGRLIENHPIGAGTFDLDIVDEATGQPPGEDTTDVTLTATGRVNGVEQVATARATILGGGANDPVDVDLSEFAVAADERITLKDRAILTRWPMAPLADCSCRVAVGVRASNGGAVEISNEAAAIDATVFHGPAASPMLVLNDGPEVDQVALLDTIPWPQAPLSGVALPSGLALNLSAIGQTLLLSNDRRWDGIKLAGTSLTLTGNISLVSEGSFHVVEGSKITVNGNVTLVSFQELRVEDSAIELAPGASLTMFVMQDLVVTDGYIGDQVVSAATNAGGGGASWMDPDRIRIHDMQAGRHWQVGGSSVMKATIFAPLTTVTMSEGATLYGALAATEVTLAGDAGLYYDPGLTSHRGVTNTLSGAFLADGHLKPAIRDLPSLAAADLQVAADAIEAPLTVGNQTYDWQDLLGDTEPEPPQEEPTPRPVHVDYEIVGFGSDFTSWEDLVH